MVCSVRSSGQQNKTFKTDAAKGTVSYIPVWILCPDISCSNCSMGGGGGENRKGQLCIPSWNVPATTTSSSCSRPASTVSASDRDFFKDRARRKPPGNRAPEDELGSLIRRMAYRFCGQRQQMRSWQCTAHTHYQTLFPHSPSNHTTRPFPHSPTSHTTRPFPLSQPATLPDPFPHSPTSHTTRPLSSFPNQPHYQTPIPIPQPATLPSPTP